MQTIFKKQPLWQIEVRNMLFAMISFFVCLMFFGCVASNENVKFPETSTDFQPKKSYIVSYNELWAVINGVLEENRIAVAAIDKSSGRIITDYIEGESTSYLGGLGGVGNSRYKYNIRISQEDNIKTRLSIIATLEQALSGAAGSTPYRDLSKTNMPLVNNLENWLYEQIEKSL